MAFAGILHKKLPWMEGKFQGATRQAYFLHPDPVVGAEAARGCHGSQAARSSASHACCLGAAQAKREGKESVLRFQEILQIEVIQEVCQQQEGQESIIKGKKIINFSSHQAVCMSVYVSYINMCSHTARHQHIHT